jgi:hypothetical protein
MERFLIYRNGSNAANQPCERRAVAIVTAESVDDARRIAEESLVFFANQTSEAIPENEADADDWNTVSEFACHSELYFVG